jgi:hypothetical protein
MSNADHKTQRPLRRPPFDHSYQFLPEQEDVVCILEHLSARFREFQTAAYTAEKLLPDRILQFMNLRAYGGLGPPQFCGRSGYTSFAGDSPEVQQMVVVQPVHVMNVS